ncbi:myb/sant-like dna-binding domain [Holotrichia oblita]|uniref:Myb/sant-like dna-binding domain n=1 Tax=Holotrichia oblita TaxID=644536 RepID=A0ACB9SYK7_HOLOL|nr:myb/sant-like dna-binding domain [Holotrichia oblita]
MQIGYRCLKPVEIAEGVFADDVVLIAENEEQLQHNVQVWNDILQRKRMKINIEKTKVMTIGGHRANIKIGNTKIQQVGTYKYLGILIDETGKQEAEISNRIEKTIKLYYTMNKRFISRREISNKTKMQVYKTIYRPTLTYGCESWVLTDSQKSRIQATEMKYLRRVKGITRKDRIRNTQIREEMNIQHINEYIQTRQMSWWGHIQRMPDNRPLASLGVNRSVEKCQRKWINLTRVYRSIKDSSKKTGRGRTSYKYFDLLDEILGNKPSNSKDTYVLDFGASSSTTTGDVIKDPIELDSNENINTSEGISVEDGPPRKKRNKNYTQEYFKEKVKYLRNKENEHELKEKRYQDRVAIEKRRNDIEAEKVQLLKEILSKLKD